MAEKRSTAAGRHFKPATRWGPVHTDGRAADSGGGRRGGPTALGVTGPAAPDSAAAASTARPGVNVAGASNAAAASSSARTLYVYGDQLRPLVEETDGVQTLNIYGPGGQIIAQVVQDGQGEQEVRYLLADHLGSTRAVLDANGNPVARSEYGPHGETTAAAEVRYRYTGHPWDEAEGVYETPARGYDPTLGRFLSVDPQRVGASPYVYAGHNPVGDVDPTGGGKVPFFIQSGFRVDANERSPRADTIAEHMGLPSGQHVLNAESLFNPGEGSSAVDVIHQQGAGWLREGHNQRLYWMVGDAPLGEVSGIRAGIDALRRWSPTLARDIVLIDNGAPGSRNLSIPIQRELTRIGENPAVVRAYADPDPLPLEFVRFARGFTPEVLRQYIDTSVAFMHPNELRRNVDSVAASVGELGSRARVRLHEFPSLLRAARTNRPPESPGISFDPMLGRITLTNRRESPGISFDPILGRITFVVGPGAAIPDVP